MIKLTFCLHRLPELTREEFQRYWREQHGPLVRKHAGALRIRRYAQVHTATDPVNEALRASRGGPPEYDGVAEVWWDSREDLAAAMTEPEGAAAGAALLDDERRFIDLARSPLWLGEEKPFIES